MELSLCYKHNNHQISFNYEHPIYIPRDSSYGFKLLIDVNTELHIQIGDSSDSIHQYNPKLVPELLYKQNTPPHGGIYCLHDFNFRNGDLYVVPQNTDYPYHGWSWLEAESIKNDTIVRHWTPATAISKSKRSTDRDHNGEELLNEPGNEEMPLAVSRPLAGMIAETESLCEASHELNKRAKSLNESTTSESLLSATAVSAVAEASPASP